MTRLSTSLMVSATSVDLTGSIVLRSWRGSATISLQPLREVFGNDRIGFGNAGVRKMRPASGSNSTYRYLFPHLGQSHECG